MIAAIPEWTFENRGPFVVLAPPQGKGRGRIHYSERHRPIRRVRDLIAGFERDPRFRIVRIGAPERVVTNEGEYAALVTVDGTLLEKPVQRTVGYVFGDDFYDQIDGLALEPEEHDRFARHVRQLVLTNDLVLGNIRRRRFYYQPPRGWQGTSNGFHTFWYPLDYPKNRSCLAVVPAYPMPQGTPEFLELVAGLQVVPGSTFVIEERSEGGSFVTQNNLHGNYWDIVGHDGAVTVYRDVVVAEDDRFVYVLVLDSPRDLRAANLELFDVFVESIEPIPQSGEARTKASKESLDHWAE